MWDYSRKLVKFFASPEFLRFFVVGFTAFIVDFGILNIQIYILNFNPFIGIISVANLISVCIAIVYGFIMQRTWAFKSKGDDVMKQGGKYAAVSLFNLVLNNIFYGILIAVGVIPPIAKILVTGAQMLWAYYLYKLFVFHE